MEEKEKGQKRELASGRLGEGVNKREADTNNWEGVTECAHSCGRGYRFGVAQNALRL